MKKNVLCLFLLWTMAVFSVPNVPEPPAKATMGVAPPPEDAPINDHLIPVLLIALLFGSYMIYRYNQRQKNPV